MQTAIRWRMENLSDKCNAETERHSQGSLFKSPSLLTTRMEEEETVKSAIPFKPLICFVLKY